MGRAGRELRAASWPRAAPSRSTAGWSGASGKTQDGNKRQAVEIIADAVQFLGGRDDGQGGGGGGFTPRSDVPVDDRDFQPARAPSGNGGGSSAADDDIPF